MALILLLIPQSTSDNLSNWILCHAPDYQCFNLPFPTDTEVICVLLKYYVSNLIGARDFEVFREYLWNKALKRLLT